MSNTNDNVNTGAAFDLAVRKHRGLLTRLERKAIAAAKGLEQAQYVHRNAHDAAAKAVERARLAEEGVVVAELELEAVKAELESK